MKLITLEEYSKKYGISTSTLRRRIRLGRCDYKIIRGRYYFPDTDTIAMTIFSRNGFSSTMHADLLLDTVIHYAKAENADGGAKARLILEAIGLGEFAKKLAA